MYYFASDIHLGLTQGTEGRKQEACFVQWLELVAQDARGIFLVGDIFDFWHEYTRVIPKGYVRVLGKLAEITDRGVPVHFFVGNHDLWAYNYLEQECGVRLHHSAYEILALCGREVLVGHGDVLGERSRFKLLRSKLFRSRAIQWLYGLIHPDWAMAWGSGWSRSSRAAKSVREPFRGEEEPIVRFARQMLEQRQIDLFICGHIHCAEYFTLNPSSSIAFLGEWIEQPTYGILNDDGFHLQHYSTQP